MATVKKLIVEVIEARNLLPIDGHGTSSPYVVVDYYGQRKKTQTVERDLNPQWNKVLKFDADATDADVFGDMLELVVFHDKAVGPTRRNNILGVLKLHSTQFVKKGEEALIHYPLSKKHFFHWVRGDVGLKIYFADDPAPPPAPSPIPATEEVKAAAPPEQAPEEAKPTSDAADSLAGDSNGSSETESSDEQKQSNNLLDPPPAPEKSVDPDGGSVLVKSSSSLATASIPEVKISGNFPGPKPISRTSSVSSFVSDVSDRSFIERSSFDLVEKMHYIFIRIVKARSLPAFGCPVVKIAVSGTHVVSRPARKTSVFEWDQTFAFGKDAPDSSSILEVSVWDPVIATQADPTSDVAGENFLGGICFDVSEILLRDPPDSPLAPQWYRLEGAGVHGGDLMLATWMGTQADESFPDAWKTDTAGNPTSRSKVYQSPKLWYLRSTVVEAQDVFPLSPLSKHSLQVKAQLGFQIQKTKTTASATGSPSWNEDLLFVAAEPFTENFLQFSLIEHVSPKEQAVIGVARIPLASIERRVDDRQVVSRWFTFEEEKEEKVIYRGRVHLRLCFDGGYHVVEEPAHVSSDYRPTARQLWKPPVGSVELGIIGCKNLLPMKTMRGKGSTDAYVVAKYGNKWVRTRTVTDNLCPRWNEQYTWRVYDPSTVLTIGVFDSWEVFESDGSKESKRIDVRMGKVRVRISTLATGKVYRNTFSLLTLSPAGLKKMGEIELAVRFVRSSPTLDLLHVYTQPMLPVMHSIKPIGVGQQELLRAAAVRLVIAHLSRSEPSLRREVVTYLLDADANVFSMRKVRANWLRIVSVMAGVIDVVKWVEDTRAWRNPTSTILVHALLVLLVWFPDLIIPTFAFYVFTIGAWNYRFRSNRRDRLDHFETKISLAESIERDELDEEFDGIPCTRPNEMVRARYDKMRVLGARVQTMLGDIATQGERVQALVAWRDPRATGIFIVLCLVVALVLYLVPSKMIALAFGFYYLRHPLFRDRKPSPALNFFRRLPSLADRML